MLRTQTSPNVAKIVYRIVPAGKIFAEDFSRPSSVIHSSVVSKYLSFISLIFTQGILPFSQYALLCREGLYYTQFPQPRHHSISSNSASPTVISISSSCRSAIISVVEGYSIGTYSTCLYLLIDRS